MGNGELALKSSSINGNGKGDLGFESSAEKCKKKRNKKKRSVPESNSNEANNDDQAGAVATQIDYNEPTMAEKPADVALIENDGNCDTGNEDSVLEATVEKSKKKKKNKNKKTTPESNFNKIDDGNCDMGNEDSTLEVTVEKSKKKKKKNKNKNKETTPVSKFSKIDDDDGVGAVGNQNDGSEPTMVDKLANLDLAKNDEDCKMIDGYIALEASDGKSKKKRSRKKRKASESTSDKIDTDEVGPIETQVDDNEPTMADKLAKLDLQKNDSKWIQKNQDSSEKQLPSADSIHVLLKQALHADDRALLLDCLYNRDDKVISNSVAQLNPSDIFKLLNSLLFIIQSRGAVLVCVLPWLRSLLLQHSSRIVSQESSLAALNSIYQLIESRVATFKPALQLASSLDLLFAGIDEDEHDEFESAPPVIYEDNDESDEEESEDNRMETDEEERNEPEEFSGISDVDASDDDLMQF